MKNNIVCIGGIFHNLDVDIELKNILDNIDLKYSLIDFNSTPIELKKSLFQFNLAQEELTKYLHNKCFDVLYYYY